MYFNRRICDAVLTYTIPYGQSLLLCKCVFTHLFALTDKRMQPVSENSFKKITDIDPNIRSWMASIRFVYFLIKALIFKIKLAVFYLICDSSCKWYKIEKTLKQKWNRKYDMLFWLKFLHLTYSHAEGKSRAQSDCKYLVNSDSSRRYRKHYYCHKVLYEISTLFNMFNLLIYIWHCTGPKASSCICI